MDESIVFVKLLPKTERSRSQQEVVADLRGALRSLSGVSVSLSTGFNPGEKQIQLQVYGTDAKELTRLARTWPTSSGRLPAPWTSRSRQRDRSRNWTFNSIAALAGSLGVTVGEVAQALRPAFAGIDVGDWIDPSGETRDVTIRLAPESRTVVGDLESLPLPVGGPGNPGRAFLSGRWRASRRRSVRRGSIISIATA